MYNDDHNHGTVQSKTKMLAKQIIKNAVITSEVKTRKVLAEITTIVQNTEVTSMGSIPKKEQKIDCVSHKEFLIIKNRSLILFKLVTNKLKLF